MMDLLRLAPAWIKGDTVRCPPEVEKHRRIFLRAVEREMALFRKVADLLKADEAKEKERWLDRQLILSQEELRKLMDYEAVLEREFERKLRQLVGWRRARRESISVDILSVDS